MFKLPRGLGADWDFLEKWSSGKQMLDIILQLFLKKGPAKHARPEN